MFKTSKQLSAELDAQKLELSDLEASFSDLQNQLAKVQDENATFAQTIAENTETIANLNAQLADKDSSLTAVTGELEEAENKIESFDKTIEDKIINAVSALGFKAKDGNSLASNQDASSDSDGEVTRQKFNSMNAREKSEFCKSGGKIK